MEAEAKEGEVTDPIAELWRVKRLLAEAQDIERTGAGRGLRSVSFKLATQKLDAVLGEALEPAVVHDAIDAGALLMRLRKIAEMLRHIAYGCSVRFTSTLVTAQEHLASLIAAAEKAKVVQDAAESGARRFERLFDNAQGVAAALDEPYGHEA